ncbi:unnamed protein product [Lactuca virosa]|uniref:F-box domain-containing protein n=1 Tax=Lactuca virosa TaxID=75947 RepID=A0AAU9MT96_9ASTR|nr:unnamed protein product [Lactuca virosa]
MVITKFIHLLLIYYWRKKLAFKIQISHDILKNKTEGHAMPRITSNKSIIDELEKILKMDRLSLLTFELIIEILSRTTLQTFVTIRCTNKYYGNLTYNKHVLHNYNRRNNVVCGVIVQQKKQWGNIERRFVPSSASNNLDIDWLPHTCTILASSLCGLLLVESYDPNEYISKILFVTKPTTTDVKSIPFPSSEYTAVKFAFVVISSNPLHFKVIRLSYTMPSDMLKKKVDYDYYNIELFSSTTWQCREFQNIQLLSFVYPVSDEAVTSGGVVISYYLMIPYCDLIFIQKNIHLYMRLLLLMTSNRMHRD